MRNGWTGGQYSLWRGGLGLGTALLLLSGPSPGWAAAGVLLAAGLLDRPAAAAVGLGLAWHPTLALPGLLAVEAALALHVTAPRAPYGSFAARGRIDPDGGWRLPDRSYAAVWTLVVVAHVAGSAHAWPGALALLRVVLLALLAHPRTRPAAWTALLALVVLRAEPLLFLHLLAFDPAWVPARIPPGRTLLLYDGQCGLCHRTVRFALAEDHQPESLALAPLDGEAAHAALADATGLPDSIVVVPPDGTPRVRSAAVLAILARLGGAWRVLGVALGWVPRPWRDHAYDAVARVRRRLFARPDEACPLLPPRLRARFLP